jgi:hypothetical protein
MFFSGEAFFLCGGNNPAVLYDGCGRVVVKGGDSEDIHGNNVA